MSYPVTAGYEAHAFYDGGTSLFVLSSSLKEDEHFIEAQGAYTTQMTQAAGKDLALDCTILSGGLVVEVTPALLSKISSLVRLRDVEASAVGKSWIVTDEGQVAWFIENGFTDSFSLSASENSLVTADISIISFKRGYSYSREPAPIDNISGGASYIQPSAPQNQRIPYWQTVWSGEWSSLENVVSWRVSWVQDFEHIYVCGASVEPQAPFLSVPGAPQVTVELEVLLEKGVEPPETLESTYLYILDQPIIFGLLKRRSRGIPIRGMNSYVIWSVTYTLLGSEPNLEAWDEGSFEETAGGVKLV